MVFYDGNKHGDGVGAYIAVAVVAVVVGGCVGALFGLWLTFGDDRPGHHGMDVEASTIRLEVVIGAILGALSGLVLVGKVIAGRLRERD